MYLHRWIDKIKRINRIDISGRLSDKVKNGLYKYQYCHNKHRCFIVGNGPSLNDIDMSLLKNEITFGSNRVYLGFDKWGFYFTYWGIEDYLQIKQGYKEFSMNLPRDMVKFIPMQYCYLFTCDNICPVNFLYKYVDYPKLSDKPDVLYLGYTVSYMLLQIAIVMGCDPIYLVGMDYNYNITEEEMKGNKWTDKNSKSHFINKYCAADDGRIWNLPRFDKTDLAFEYASKWAQQNGRQILNATPNSELTFFPKMNYESIFE